MLANDKLASYRMRLADSLDVNSKSTCLEIKYIKIIKKKFKKKKINWVEVSSLIDLSWVIQLSWLSKVIELSWVKLYIRSIALSEVHSRFICICPGEPFRIPSHPQDLHQGMSDHIGDSANCNSFRHNFHVKHGNAESDIQNGIIEHLGKDSDRNFTTGWHSDRPIYLW